MRGCRDTPHCSRNEPRANLVGGMSAKVNLAISPDEVSGLILAGGDGIRVGEGPKAFLKLGDKTLLEHVIELIGPYAGELIVG